MILLQRSKCLRSDAVSLGKWFPVFKRTEQHIRRNFNPQSHQWQKPRTLHTMASLNADTISCKNEDSTVSCQVKYVLDYFRYYQDSDYHGVDTQENAVQNLVGIRALSLLPIIQTNYEDHPALYLMGTSESFPRHKVAKHEANSLSPPSVKIKNVRCLISIPPHAFIVRTVTILLLLSRHRALLQVQYIKQNLLQVKQYLYRPGQALRVLGSSGSQISNQHMKVVRLSALCPGHLHPQVIILVLVSVKGWVEPRTIVWPEGLSQ
jgi:hypothetical protein